MKDTNAQRNQKDTMFRMLFSEKENLLSLYNALNKTSYTDTGKLTITTLENAVYMNYKNDISFVFNSELMLYEHQSTVNPNMPLRDLIYVTSIIQGLTKDADLYSSTPIKLPAPQFVVFYNGTTKQPEQKILKLSDAYETAAYEKQGGNPDLELVVTVYNINFGHNSELMEACQILKEYAQYVQKVREYAKERSVPEAVELAVDYCIRNGILADFLSKNRAEAIAVSIFEYDEEKHIKSEKELSYQEGLKQGEKRGEERGLKHGEKIGLKRGEEIGLKRGEEIGEARLNLLYKKLFDENRIEDLKRSMVDTEYQKKLYTEYGI